jgi:N-methylhydantoinase A
MEEEARILFKQEQIPESAIKFVHSMDMRYLKQYHELNVMVSSEEIYAGDIESIAKKFHPEHNRLYGYSLKEEGTPIELINCRLLAIGKTPKPKFYHETYDGEDPGKALKKKRRVWLPIKHKFSEVSVFDGARLTYGNRIEGPAIIEQVNTTTFVTPEYNVLCDRYGSYTMVLKEKEEEIKEKILP